MSERLYLVDFDGVICDSRIECMVTSYVAYQILSGRNSYKPAYSVEEVPAACASQFIEFRYLARTAKEFMMIWDLIEAGKSIDPDLPLHLQLDVDRERLMQFHDLFYSRRYIWMETDVADWIGIHRLYPGMTEWLSVRLAQGKAQIVSSKDRRSILTILRSHGVELADELVSGGDEGDKHEHFIRLREQHPDRELFFLDDNVENLVIADTYGIEGCLCSWGYTWEGGIAAAREKGFQILDLEQVATLN
jgi:hypothetical protein